MARWSGKRRGLALAAIFAIIAVAGLVLYRPSHDRQVGMIKGTVWQVDNATVDAQGNWHRLGAEELITQWMVVDELAFMPGTGLKPAPRMPDWDRIAKEPWAKSVILGMAGRFSEQEARAGAERLAELSVQIANLPTPLNVAGWYFPVEVDPTWQDAPALVELLEKLPRPLWISVYDSANVGAVPLTQWLTGWLPEDVGILFQDGVGVHARDAATARQYADTLAAGLGAERLRVIVEAFRPDGAGGFRAASAEELAVQIDAMQGYDIYLFDGPHYVHDGLIDNLLEKQQTVGPQG